MRYTGEEATLKRMLEEYRMIGYEAEIKDGELIVYLARQSKKAKKAAKAAAQPEKWSKREREFGYTRG